MPRAPLPEHLVEMLKKPNPAVMATTRPDGAPVSVATWYLWDDGRILLNLDARRKRLDHIRADPRVSLTVLDSESWYQHLSVQGPVELVPDPDLGNIDRIAQHYIQSPYPDREHSRVSCWLDIATWHSWNIPSEPTG